MKRVVRQNPSLSVERIAGELCPAHGLYHPDRLAKFLHEQAVAQGVDVDRARALLDQSMRLRRRCPDCGGQAPSMRAWAERQRTPPGMPNRYAGECPCGVHVPAKAGTVSRERHRWIVRCRECSWTSASSKINAPSGTGA